MKKIVIFFNPNKEQAALSAQNLVNSFIELEIQAISYATQEDASRDWGLIEKDTDLIVVLGGDGTFLLTAKQAYDYDLPLLGVNFGHLGFLSEYGDIAMQELAQAIAEENFQIEKRSILKAKAGEEVFYAVNDIAVNRSLDSNLLYTDLFIDDNLLHSFRSDGIVICTPTGSTAYALSAGGSVMDPNIRAFQIVPIAAHSLNSRPHVVSDSQKIVLASKGKDQNKEFFLQADGKDLHAIEPGTQITISKAEKELQLVHLGKPERNFYSILRDKMKWGAISN